MPASLRLPLACYFCAVTALRWPRTRLFEGIIIMTPSHIFSADGWVPSTPGICNDLFLRLSGMKTLPVVVGMDGVSWQLVEPQQTAILGVSRTPVTTLLTLPGVSKTTFINTLICHYSTCDAGQIKADFSAPECDSCSYMSEGHTSLTERKRRVR